MKKLYFNIAVIVLTFLTIIGIGKVVGGPSQQIITWGANSFVATWLAVFICGLAGLGPVGTNSKVSPKKGLEIASICVIVVAFFCGGIFGAVGALIGTGASWFYFRGAL
jgi:hypothetical protein